MKRLTAIVMRPDAPELIRRLQMMSCVDITESLPKQLDSSVQGAPSFRRTDVTAIASSISQRLNEAIAARDFLAGYITKSKSFLSAPDEIDINSYDTDFMKSAETKIRRACKISAELRSLNTEAQSISGEIDALAPWTSLHQEIPQAVSRSAISTVGLLPPKLDTSSLDSKLESLACTTEIVEKNERGIQVILTAHRDDFDEAMRIASEFGFVICPSRAAEKDGYAAGRIAALESRCEEIKLLLSQDDAEARDLAESIKDIETYIDLTLTEEARTEAAEKLSESDRTVILTGWTPESAEAQITSLLDSFGAAYSFEEADNTDDPPILFLNNRFAAQFEPVVELYSPPAYGSFDPTSIMSIFYIIIFGLMLADVGYGLLISTVCLLALHLMKPRGNMKKMLTMFAICGVSCIVMGLLFGGYFSDTPTVLMQNWFGIENPPELALLFSPLTSPIPFLAVSLGIGAVHLITALAIKFYVTWARGHRLDAICDQGSWIILFAGAGVFFLNRMVGLVLVLTGVAMLILTQGRSERNIFMKLFRGIASLYDIVGYLSDLLSYSRILALGLASMVVGSVFNILGALPGLSVIGVIFFVLIFAIGHLLNVAVNLLGTFVHTSRLQYIEFFGKFYEDGGHMFAPLAPRSKYSVFKITPQGINSKEI